MKKIWKKIVLVWLCILAIVIVFLLWPHQTIATIMIDPGHGGYDTGAIGADGVTAEKDLTLAISLRLGKEIRRINPKIKVKYTRENDQVTWPSEENQDLQTRVQMTQQAQADYFICIHINATDSNPDATGYSFHVRDDDEISISLAHEMEKNLEKAHWSESRGIVYTSQAPLYAIDHLSIPSMLIETGFITNEHELYQLKQVHNQKKIAKALARAICDQIQSESEQVE